MGFVDFEFCDKKIINKNVQGLGYNEEISCLRPGVAIDNNKRLLCMYHARKYIKRNPHGKVFFIKSIVTELNLEKFIKDNFNSYSFIG